MEAICGSGFWGRSKPFCSACGWNVETATEMQRQSFKLYLWGLAICAGFLIFIGFSVKDEIEDIAIPFCFLLLVLGGTFFSWRKLKRLESLNSLVASAYPPPSLISTTNGRNLRKVSADKYQQWLNLSKPRRVRFKFVPGFILIAFPVAMILVVIFGAQFGPDAIRGSRAFRDVLPLLIFVLVISALAISTIRNSLRDRKLMTEGNLAIATVTSQGSTGGRHPKSKIRYKFMDAAGQMIEGEGTDNSWEIYEDMEMLVFYKPEDPKINVPICGASCELKAD
jgi:hypothetical protein